MEIKIIHPETVLISALIGSPVLKYTWGAGSLMTSLQEDVDLDELVEEVNPQAVVSG